MYSTCIIILESWTRVDNQSLYLKLLNSNIVLGTQRYKVYIYLLYHALSLPVCILCKSLTLFWQQKSLPVFWILLQHLFFISINLSYFRVLHFLLFFCIFVDSFLCLFDFQHSIQRCKEQNTRHNLGQTYGNIFENFTNPKGDSE